jgi:hypothetical protein
MSLSLLIRSHDDEGNGPYRATLLISGPYVPNNKIIQTPPIQVMSPRTQIRPRRVNDCIKAVAISLVYFDAEKSLRQRGGTSDVFSAYEIFSFITEENTSRRSMTFAENDIKRSFWYGPLRECLGSVIAKAGLLLEWEKTRAAKDIIVGEFTFSYKLKHPGCRSHDAYKELLKTMMGLTTASSTDMDLVLALEGLLTKSFERYEREAGAEQRNVLFQPVSNHIQAPEGRVNSIRLSATSTSTDEPSSYSQIYMSSVIDSCDEAECLEIFEMATLRLQSLSNAPIVSSSCATPSHCRPEVIVSGY